MEATTSRTRKRRGSGRLHTLDEGGRPVPVLLNVNGEARHLRLKLRRPSCSKEGCAGCPHGPYVYVSVAGAEGDRDLFLGLAWDPAKPKPAAASTRQLVLIPEPTR